MYRVAVLSCPVSLLTLLFEPRRRPKGKSLSPRPFCQQRQGLNIVDNITSIHFAFGVLLFLSLLLVLAFVEVSVEVVKKRWRAGLQINQLVLYTIHNVYLDYK